MRGVIIQVSTLLATFGIVILGTYIVALNSKPEEFLKSLRMGAFSDVHAEPRYDPNVSNERYCKKGTTAF